ncbi:MAG: aminotransferase class V-fold PLP-dependent enzyme [bacterium]|nr:aminotransferase class V-fold PLP-dependent enzyme [bacterium]
MIYLDNAATTLHKPPQVAEAVKQAILTAGNAARGAHGASMQASRTVFETRQKLARLLGCPQADHVVFTANSTMALNIAITGILSPGDHAISTDLEHNSVLRPLYALHEQGVALSFVPAGKQGRVRYEDFASLFRPNTKAVICTHASNLTGNMLDLACIAAMAHEHGALLIVDASQTAGAVPIDMTAMGVDVLCFTGHKGLMGPQGTGGLCIRPGVEIRPLLRGGSGVHSFDRQQPAAYPTRLEAGTLNSHGIAGLDAAVDYLLSEGVAAIEKREQALMWRFYENVCDIDGVQVYGDFAAQQRAAIVALNIRDYDSAEIADVLFADYGIATRPGAHCAPRMHQALGTVQQGVVRFSFSVFNTEDEVDAAIQAVRELAQT